MSTPPSLFVATQSADGVMLSDYVASLAGALIRLGEAGIGVEYGTVDGVDIVVQRNLLTQRFLASACTHILYVDSDMLFPPDLALRLLACRKRLVGAIYPRRDLNLDRLRRLSGEHGFARALPLAYDWNVQFLDDTVTVREGLARVATVPGGFLLVERACFDEMAARIAVPVLAGGPDGASFQAFFREKRDGEAVSDLDYAFCRRWSECGGEVWAYVNAEIRHVGDFRGAPPYRAYLDALRRDAARATA